MCYYKQAQESLSLQVTSFWRTLSPSYISESGLLRDIPSTLIVTGCTEEEHLQNLQAIHVLSRLEEEGLILKKRKCQLMMKEVVNEHLTHVISAEGLRPATSKPRAILEAPTPKNVYNSNHFWGK